MLIAPAAYLTARLKGRFRYMTREAGDSSASDDSIEGAEEVGEASGVEESFLQQLQLHVREVRQQSNLWRLYVCLAAAGGGVSILFGLLPVFAAKELDASTAEIGVYFTVVTLISIPVNLAVGRWTDNRRGRNLVAVLICVWVGMGLFGLSTVENLLGLFVLGGCFLVFLDASNAQLLAFGRESLSGLESKQQVSMMSTVRTAYAFGYVAGPLIAGGLLMIISIRWAIVSCGLLYLISGWVYLTSDSRSGTRMQTIEPASAKAAGHTRRGMFLAAVALTLILACPVARAAYLVLFAMNDLHTSLTTVVVIIGIAPLAELMLMPICGIAAARWGPRRVVLIGAAVAVTEMFLIAMADSVWQLALLQLLGAFVLATVVAVGMTWIQDLAKSGFRFGTSVFLSCRAAGSVLGNGIGGVVGSYYSLRWTFVAAGVGAVIGFLIIAAFCKPVGNSTAPPGTAEPAAHHPPGNQSTVALS